MRRSITRIIPLLLLPVMVQQVRAQCVVRGWDSVALAKCDASLRMLLAVGTARDTDSRKERSGTAGRIGRDGLQLFMTGDPTRIGGLVRRVGGTTGGVVGTLVTATVPADRLPGIAADTSVLHIELASRVELFNDSVRASIRADQVHRGIPPLYDGYTGKGVILGFIDTGIDYRHPEFREARDPFASRIVALWAQHGSGGVPPPTFGYGSEWSAAQIQSAIEGHGDPDFEMHDFIGHGTHVAATAAGLHGMAPDAEIIMVQLRDVGGTWDDFAASVLDAAIYIYEKAEALGRPCVINASLGNYLHPQDGSDPLARTLDTLIGNHAGRFFVAAAGNSGGRSYHWCGRPGRDSAWIYVAGGQAVFRVPDSSLARFAVAVQFDDLSCVDSVGHLGGTVFRDGHQLRRSLVVIDTIRTADPAGALISRMTATPAGPGETEIVINCTNLGEELTRLIVKGDSPFDCWSEGFLPATSVGHGSDEAYGVADGAFTTATPAIAHGVISVGSYVNRSQYLTADGVLVPSDPLQVGALSEFSSCGPATDGRIKPEIMAPGSYVISARSRDVDRVHDENLVPDPLSIVSSGTSMASPAVAGAVALYLQAHPHATVDEVRSALTRMARRDRFTEEGGSTPNGAWGYGKLDIFAAMTEGISVSASSAEPVSIIEAQPNPGTGGEVTIRYRVERDEAASLSIYNALGQTLLAGTSLPVEAGVHTSRIDPGGWPAGMYRVVVVTPSGHAAAKLLLLR